VSRVKNKFQFVLRVVVQDHGDSNTEVEPVCIQSPAPSSTNAVTEEVATHGRVSEKKTLGVP